MQITNFIKYIQSWEGGYVNDPRDSGGATNKGITIATFRSVFGQSKTIDDLKKMTDEQWWTVFKTKFWDKYKADNIKDEWLRYLLVDWLWGSGKWAITKVQKLLGLNSDGIVGDKTIAAINSKDPKKLFDAVWQMREKFLYDISKGKNSVFLKGWLRRLNGIKYGYLVTNNGTILK